MIPTLYEQICNKFLSCSYAAIVVWIEDADLLSFSSELERYGILI